MPLPFSLLVFTRLGPSPSLALRRPSCQPPRVTPISSKATKPRSGRSTPRRATPATAAPPQRTSRPWFVYLPRCANGALYTGIATDVLQRLSVHNAGQGSAYVRAHRPATLLAFTPAENRSAASILEHHVKSLTQPQKLALAKKGQAKQPRRE